MNKTVALVLGGIIIAGVAFYGGMKYDQYAAASARQGRLQQFAGAAGSTAVFRGTRTGGAAGGATGGSIVSKDANSLTLSLANGGSEIVFVSSSTQVSKMTTGSLNDLSAGNDVFVTGTPNPDGSLTAESIQLRPAPVSAK
ncbi:MAG: hypothetical protein KGI60_04520 [Patescibacteria group bacterium]|nr:hypothetical protein [Patescibacteria group bacterium]